MVLRTRPSSERHDDLYVGWGPGLDRIRQPVAQPRAAEAGSGGWPRSLATAWAWVQYMPSRTWTSTRGAAARRSGIDYAKFRKEGVVMGPKTADHIRKAPRSPSTRHRARSSSGPTSSPRPLRPGASVHGAREGPGRLLPPRHRARPRAPFSRHQTNLLSGTHEGNEVWVNAGHGREGGLRNGQ